LEHFRQGVGIRPSAGIGLGEVDVVAAGQQGGVVGNLGRLALVGPVMAEGGLGVVEGDNAIAALFAVGPLRDLDRLRG